MNRQAPNADGPATTDPTYHRIGGLGWTVRTTRLRVAVRMSDGSVAVADAHTNCMDRTILVHDDGDPGSLARNTAEAVLLAVRMESRAKRARWRQNRRAANTRADAV